jgi:hypothetical protein
MCILITPTTVIQGASNIVMASCRGRLSPVTVRRNLVDQWAKTPPTSAAINASTNVSVTI